MTRAGLPSRIEPLPVPCTAVAARPGGTSTSSLVEARL